jgi:hypothetical protein
MAVKIEENTEAPTKSLTDTLPMCDVDLKVVFKAACFLTNSAIRA